MLESLKISKTGWESSETRLLIIPTTSWSSESLSPPLDAQQWELGLEEIGIPQSWEIAALDFRHHTGSCIGTGKLKGVWLL